MCGRAARTSRNGASTISARIRRKSSGANSSSGLTRWMPALLISTSASSRQLVELAGCRSDRRPRPCRRSVRATAGAASSSRSATVTRAPAAASMRAHAAADAAATAGDERRPAVEHRGLGHPPIVPGGAARGRPVPNPFRHGRSGHSPAGSSCHEGVGATIPLCTSALRATIAPNGLGGAGQTAPRGGSTWSPR